MRRELVKTPAFMRAAKKLLKRQPNLDPALAATLAQLADDAFHPSLATHKLSGNQAGRWSCSVGYDCRIVFRIAEVDGSESIQLLTIGTHDEVD